MRRHNSTCRFYFYFTCFVVTLCNIFNNKKMFFHVLLESISRADHSNIYVIIVIMSSNYHVLINVTQSWRNFVTYYAVLCHYTLCRVIIISLKFVDDNLVCIYRSIKHLFTRIKNQLKMEIVLLLINQRFCEIFNQILNKKC